MKKVIMTLEGLNGNAVHLLAAFTANARQQGWNETDIDAVADEAMAGNYDHLLQILNRNIEPPEER